MVLPRAGHPRFGRWCQNVFLEASVVTEKKRHNSTARYVYGGQELHVYHQQILFDQSLHSVSSKPGYDYLFAFTPDPNVPSFALDESAAQGET